MIVKNHSFNCWFRTFFYVKLIFEFLFRWRGMEVDPTPVSPWGTTTLCQIPSAWISRGHTSEVEVSVEVLLVRWTAILDISGTLPLAVDYQLWTPMMTGPDSWQVEAGLWGIAARHGSISAGDIQFYFSNKMKRTLFLRSNFFIFYTFFKIN